MPHFQTTVSQALPPPATTTTTTDPRVADIAARLRAQIAAGQLDPGGAVAIIRAAAGLLGGDRAAASWDLVEDVIAELAKGADGVSGTQDDLIPPPTAAMLSALLHGGVVRDMVAWATGGGGGGRRLLPWSCGWGWPWGRRR